MNSHGRADRPSRRRGIILPITLLILMLLGVLAASSSFYVYADLSSTQSMAHRLQTRLAAEAGLQKVMLLLRTERNNMDAWHHNPEELHRIIVWSDEGGLEALGTNLEFEDGLPAYRFSIVADDPLDDEKQIRFGITDESTKVNINVASKGQLALLIQRFTTEEMILSELVDALVDWRDADDNPGAFGAESEYYSQLEPPYAVKNAPFDTVEELLLVRGFTGQLLYGEDYDRNGLLSPNEDDGDLLFPPDDADGTLNRGLFSYITVYSRDMNTASDNKPRVYLFSEPAVVRAQLAEFIDDPAKLDFIAGAGTGEPRITSPAGLLLPRSVKDSEEPTPSPITEDDLEWIMDRCTTSQDPESIGLININTASPIVLSTLAELTDEEIEAIVQTRENLPIEQKRSTGWLVLVVGVEKFVSLAPKLTARGMRYRVESLGYGDHIGTMTRLEAVIEMRGPIAQIVYNRDLTTLGTNFPIRYAEGDSELAGYDR